MQLDPARFERLRSVVKQYPVFREEIEQLRPEEFTPWPVHDAYSHGWNVFPFFLDSYPETLQVDFEHNQRRCPRSARILNDLPLQSAAFSRMEPGCHIYLHTDHPTPDVLRVHLGLAVPERAGMRVADQIIRWHEGECMVFDGQIEHQTANLSDRPRTVLLVDFVSSEQERAYVDSLSGATRRPAPSAAPRD